MRSRTFILALEVLEPGPDANRVLRRVGDALGMPVPAPEGDRRIRFYLSGPEYWKPAHDALRADAANRDQRIVRLRTLEPRKRVV